MKNEVIKKETEIKTLVDETGKEVRSIKITDGATYEKAVEFCREIKRRAKTVEEYWKPLVQQAQKTHKDLVSARDTALKPFREWEADIKRNALAYSEAEEEKRRAEQRRIDEINRKKAEEEQKARAEEAEAFGGDEAKKAVLEEKPVPVAVIVPSSKPKAAGASFTEKWEFEVVAEGIIPRQFLMVDEKKLRKYAEAMREKASVPGVKFYTRKVMGIRA